MRDILDARKAQEIVTLDVRDSSSVTDYYVITSGMSPPHLKALYGELQQQLKRRGVECYRRSGQPEAGWMVLDYVDVIIHIFLPETRAFYAIESLWDQAPRVA